MAERPESVTLSTQDWSRSQFELVVSELQLRKIDFMIGAGEIKLSPEFEKFVLGLISDSVRERSERGSLATTQEQLEGPIAETVSVPESNSAPAGSVSPSLAGDWRRFLIPGIVAVIIVVAVVWVQFFPRYSAKFWNCSYDRQSNDGYVYCDFTARNKTFDDRVYNIEYRVSDSTGQWFEESAEVLVKARDEVRTSRFQMGSFFGIPWSNASLSASITDISVR